VSNSNNDSANITEIALFEKYLSGNNSHDIQGFYNLQATNKSHFNEFSLSSSSDNKLQPDISFNNYASNFMVTYYDSTMQKLPFLTNDMNLVNPNSWTIVSSGYNDSSNLLAPHPKVELNLEQQNGVNVWTAGRAGENGIAMFDGPYNYPAGISQDHQKEFAILYGAHPNPCKDVTNIGFELKKPEKVNITLFDMYGQPIEMLTDQNYSAGKHDLRIDVSKYPSGTYIYKFQTSETVTSNRLIVVK
jgi:hypothetical protein